MRLNLTDRRFIITGSSRGIGAAIAEGLVEEGARVTVTGRNGDEVGATAARLNRVRVDAALAFVGDLTQQDALAALAARVEVEWHGVDGLVANAGAVRPVPDVIVDDADWDWYLDANVHLTRRLVQRFLPMLPSPGGVIVAIGSIAGVSDVGAPLPYGGAKALLANYVQGLARRVGADGIRANVVEPGNIVFDGGNWERRQRADPMSVQSMLDAKVPLARLGRPDEIADAVMFLLSDRSGFTTGVRFVVDGGQIAGL